MGLKMEFSIEGDKQISAELGITADHLSDFSKPMKDSADAMMTAVEDNYDQRGKRFKGWDPRKPTTPPSTHPLLEKTGKMRGAMYQDSGKDFAMVANKDPKFPYHQSNQPRSKIPRRIMLMIDDRLRTEIFKIFQEYIVYSLRGKR